MVPRCFTSPASAIVIYALSSLDAALSRLREKYRAQSMRALATWRARSWEGHTSRRLRKKIEMLFAHLKRILKLDRLRLRGPNGARDEFILAATGQNLRKMAKLIPMPTLRPT